MVKLVDLCRAGAIPGHQEPHVHDSPAVESSAECRRSWAQSAALHCVRNSIRDETVPCRAGREDLARDLKDYETDALATAPFPRGVIGGTSGQYVHGACSCS